MMQWTPRVYSTLFSTIHDEPAPYGALGGAHYSVFRSLLHYDAANNRLGNRDQMALHHLALIWDEDHDIRIITVLEQLAINQLLSPVAFIGESRGRVTILLWDGFYTVCSAEDQEAYKMRVRELFMRPWHADTWSVNFGRYQAPQGRPHNAWLDLGNILPMHGINALTYLDNVCQTWVLGIRPFEVADSLVAQPQARFTHNWPHTGFTSTTFKPVNYTPTI